MDPATLALNETAYDIYGAPNVSVFFAFTYGSWALPFHILRITVWGAICCC